MARREMALLQENASTIRITVDSWTSVTKELQLITLTMTILQSLEVNLKRILLEIFMTF